MGQLVIEGIILGILSGGVYALMSSGLSLVFGVMDIINVGQGALVILGAYLSYALQHYLHIDLFLGLLITMPAMFLVGLALALIFRPIKRDRTILSVLVTFGVALIIEGVLNLVFTASTVGLQGWYVNDAIPLTIFKPTFYLPYIYVFGFILAVVLIVALYILLYLTKFGRSVRAAMENRTAAELIGINVERVSMITLGIGVALAASGGMVFGATTGGFNANSAYDLISRLLAIVVFGGLGSVSGAMVASVSMLVIESVTDQLWDPRWATVVFFVLLVIVLVFRPQGLLGQKEGRKQ